MTSTSKSTQILYYIIIIYHYCILRHCFVLLLLILRVMRPAFYIIQCPSHFIPLGLQFRYIIIVDSYLGYSKLKLEVRGT